MSVNSTDKKKVVGFKVNDGEFEALQTYAIEMYNAQILDQNTGQARRMLESPKVGQLGFYIWK